MQKFLSFLLLVTVATSCTKTETPEVRKKFIGKWQMKALTTTRLLEKVEQSKVIKSDFSNNDYMQFNNDGTGYVSFAQEEGEDVIGNMTFFAQTSDERNIYVQSAGKDHFFQIMTINSATMTIQWGYGSNYGGPNGNQEFSVEHSLVLTKAKN